MEKKQRRKNQILFIAVILLISVGTMLYIGQPLVEFVSDAEGFRLWVEEKGWWSRIAFMLMLCIQVVFAFIPGGVFEVAGGYAFGALEGTALSVVGTTLGSAVVFLLVKRFGMKFALLFFSQEKLDSAKFMHNEKRMDLLVFIAFVIPGTPKDLLCYVAGLTDMSLKHWLIISSIARVPAILISTIGGNAIGSERYTFAVVVFVLTIILSVIGMFVYHRLTLTEKQQEEDTQE